MNGTETFTLAPLATEVLASGSWLVIVTKVALLGLTVPATLPSSSPWFCNRIWASAIFFPRTSGTVVGKKIAEAQILLQNQGLELGRVDRKSTRLNSSHGYI